MKQTSHIFCIRSQSTYRGRALSQKYDPALLRGGTKGTRPASQNPYGSSKPQENKSVFPPIEKRGPARRSSKEERSQQVAPFFCRKNERHSFALHAPGTPEQRG